MDHMLLFKFIGQSVPSPDRVLSAQQITLLYRQHLLLDGQ